MFMWNVHVYSCLTTALLVQCICLRGSRSRVRFRHSIMDAVVRRVVFTPRSSLKSRTRCDANNDSFVCSIGSTMIVVHIMCTRTRRTCVVNRPLFLKVCETILLVAHATLSRLVLLMSKLNFQNGEPMFIIQTNFQHREPTSEIENQTS